MAPKTEPRCDRTARRIPAPGLAEIGSGRRVDDNQPPVRQGLDGMAHIAGHDRNESWLCDLGHTINGHFQLALDYFVAVWK